MPNQKFLSLIMKISYLEGKQDNLYMNTDASAFDKIKEALAKEIENARQEIIDYIEYPTEITIKCHPNN